MTTSVLDDVHEKHKKYIELKNVRCLFLFLRPFHFLLFSVRNFGISGSQRQTLIRNTKPSIFSLVNENVERKVTKGWQPTTTPIHAIKQLFIMDKSANLSSSVFWIKFLTTSYSWLELDAHCQTSLLLLNFMYAAALGALLHLSPAYNSSNGLTSTISIWNCWNECEAGITYDVQINMALCSLSNLFAKLIFLFFRACPRLLLFGELHF